MQLEAAQNIINALRDYEQHCGAVAELLDGVTGNISEEDVAVVEGFVKANLALKAAMESQGVIVA